jgi:hypothetical protein
MISVGKFDACRKIRHVIQLSLRRSSKCLNLQAISFLVLRDQDYRHRHVWRNDCDTRRIHWATFEALAAPDFLLAGCHKMGSRFVLPEGYAGRATAERRIIRPAVEARMRSKMPCNERSCLLIDRRVQSSATRLEPRGTHGAAAEKITGSLTTRTVREVTDLPCLISRT